MIKASVKLDIPTLKKLRRNIDLRKNAVKKRLTREMGKYLEQVKESAQEIIRSEAYDTGRLYNSIKIRWDEKSYDGSVYSDGRVARNQDGKAYSEFVEFGHYLFPYGNKNAVPRWIPGVYYMTRAVAKHRRQQRGVVMGVIDAFNHYDKGGEWYMAGKSAAYFGKTGKKLYGSQLQKAFGSKTKAGRAISKMRKRATRVSRNKRSKNR